jgi:endoglucanase
MEPQHRRGLSTVGRAAVTLAWCLAATALVACGVDSKVDSEVDSKVDRDVGGEVGGEVGGFLGTDGAEILDGDGRPVQLRGVNWFGLETSSCMPHGLWSRPLDDVMSEIAAAGFTMIRLPYANQCLDEGVPTGLNEAENPELVGLSTLELMDAVVAAADEHDVRILLDRHRPGFDAQSELWYTDDYPEERWIADWVMLAERYRDDPTVIGADLHNEPHGPSCWGCGEPGRDWPAAAERAGDAIGQVHPGWLIVVEGVERMNDGSTTWWGGGLADVRDRPVELEIPDRVVYSPHDYPASVFAQEWFSDPAYPDNLRGLWEANWGYVASEGLAPVLLGEFGTRFETESDQQWLTALVDHLHEARLSFAYWSWNPDSGDTGGLVKDDWATPEQEKLDALGALLG